MDSTLQYARDVLNGKFVKIKELMEDIIKREVGDWYNIVNSYLEELGITWDSLYTLTKKEIKTLTQNYDTWQWEKEMSEKKILKYYREGKGKLQYEFCYRNNLNSMFYARARLNALGLEEAKSRGKKFYNKTCKLCNQGEEDLMHFLLVCPSLEKGRDYNIINKSIEEPKTRLIDCLFRNKEYQKVGKMIKNMWGIRKDKLKTQKERNKIRYIQPAYSDPGPKRADRRIFSPEDNYWDKVGLIFRNNNRGV